MSIRLPGTIGLKLPFPTPEFRYDNGIAGGHIAFGVWVYPEDVSEQQEIIAFVDRIGTNYSYAVFAVLRLEGSTGGDGTITVILQGGAFGLCVVRRSVPGTLVVNRWQRIDVVCPTSIVDCHLYVDGVEVTYAFTRSEENLPPNGGGDVLFGSTFRGLDGGPRYTAGIRLVAGDLTNGDIAKRFTTAPGTFFTGGLAHAGFWHAGRIPESGMVESLADGFSPLFFNHFFENSSVSKGLLMAPALYGEEPESEVDPISGIGLDYTSGTGVASWMDGPGVCEPCPLEIDGPGPEVPKNPRLCIPFGLPRAEIYENPGNPADLLPIVYGDFRLGGLRGPVPATLIDKGEDDLGPWVYCAAFHPVMSIDLVYIDDAIAGGYEWSQSDNFQNKGTIATITFTVQPRGQVSWRGRGIYDRTGAELMENCLDQLVHLLTTWGNFDLREDFDLTALSEATAKINQLGYRTAFVVFSEAVTQDWITEMLFNVMGYWRVNGREQLEFHVDDGYATLRPSDLTAEVLAPRDCIDGDDGVSFTLDRGNLVNDITAYHLYSYSLDVPTSRLVGLTDQTSIAAYGTMKKAVTLKGLRRQDDVRTWAAILLMRQSARTRVEGGLVEFTLFGGRFAHLTVGDLITFTWPYGPTRESGNPYASEILRIANLTIDLSRGGAMKVLAVDLGMRMISGTASIPDLPALPSNPPQPEP